MIHVQHSQFMIFISFCTNNIGITFYRFNCFNYITFFHINVSQKLLLQIKNINTCVSLLFWNRLKFRPTIYTNDFKSTFLWKTYFRSRDKASISYSVKIISEKLADVNRFTANGRSYRICKNQMMQFLIMNSYFSLHWMYLEPSKQSQSLSNTKVGPIYAIQNKVAEISFKAY